MNFKAFLLSAAVFAPLVFASSAPSNFDAFVPKNEKASAEYKQTVTAVTGKMDSITACGASSADFEGFKTCVAKLNLPQLLVDNFPADSYKDAKAVEVAMNAYSAALTKKIDRKIIQKAEEHEENTEATSISTDKDEKTALSAVLLYGNMAFWFLLYAGVSVLFVVGFFLIVYTYFVRKTEAVDFFLRAEIVLSYKFRTKDAKNYFDNQKGTECVHKALVVEQCGKDHLLAKEPAGQVEYTACIKKIGLPAEFETEVLALQPFDFKTPATFEYTYNQKLINYVKKIDNMYQGSARLTTLQFSFNWLALLAVPLAFGIVFFLNKKPEATASDEVVESV